MLEVTGYFTAFDDGGYNRHLSLTMLTLSHIDLEDFSLHFPQLEFLTGLPFFSSGFRTILLRQGELGAKTPLHLTKWDLGGEMMSLNFFL